MLGQYMEIFFQRPVVKRFFDKFQPNEVYYCGGAMPKHELQVECVERNIPLFCEDFDEAPKTLNYIKSFWTKK